MKMLRPRLLVALALVACNPVDELEDTNPPVTCEDTAPPDDPVDSDGDGWTDDQDCDDSDPDIYPGGDEYCDGIDSDCDGELDDGDAIDAGLWYADEDGDGFGDPDNPEVGCGGDGWSDNPLDCDDTDPAVHPGAEDEWGDGVDSDCDGLEDPSACESLPEGGSIPVNEDCVFTPVDSFEVVEEWSTMDWSWGDNAHHEEVVSLPVVGQLTDDNGDGVVDSADMPDIAFITYSGHPNDGGTLRVVSGDGSGEHLSVSEVIYNGVSYTLHGMGAPALGDLEGDGEPEILVNSTRGMPIALNTDGSVKWVGTYTSYCFSAKNTSINISDLDGDGDAEVVHADRVFDSDGSLVARFTSGDGYDCTGNIAFYYGSFGVDLDGDGVQEILGGGQAWDLDGQPLWPSSYMEGALGVGNFDGDDRGEVIHHHNNVVTLIDDDGSAIWQTEVTDGYGGSPCVADLDEDGEAELVVAAKELVVALDTDGSVMWRQSIEDYSSNMASCSAFDLNGDGVVEVMFADEETVWIFNGRDGEVLHQFDDHTSGTTDEYPVIADVDNDGNAEMLVVANEFLTQGRVGLTVYGEANDMWASARSTWNQHAYFVDNINDDLSVPSLPAPPWESHNTFHSQVSWSETPNGAPDLQADIVGICEDCDEGVVSVYVVVQNSGQVFASASTEVSLFNALSGSVEPIATQTLGAALDPGVVTEPMEFVLSLGDIGERGVYAHVDPEDLQLECDEDNNLSNIWDDFTCDR